MLHTIAQVAGPGGWSGRDMHEREIKIADLKNRNKVARKMNIFRRLGCWPTGLRPWNPPVTTLTAPLTSTYSNDDTYALFSNLFSSIPHILFISEQLWHQHKCKSCVWAHLGSFPYLIHSKKYHGNCFQFSKSFIQGHHQVSSKMKSWS